MVDFKPLTTTAVELRTLLESGDLTSTAIVEKYLDQIQRYDKAGPCLNALISVAPRHILISEALRLDSERASGRTRGPFHGIPIILKDAITTSSELGMSTTAGSWAFVETRAKKNSALVDKLVDAGMIIIAKANLTEFCGLRTPGMMTGWSSYGGQTLSPYVGKIEPGEKILGHSVSSRLCAKDIYLIICQSPGGSSTGSAVSVAAGFAPLAIGTETIGSIVTPTGRAGLYALKPTVGDVDMGGVLGISTAFDSAGPMAKSARDLLPLVELMLRTPRNFKVEEDFGELKMGFVDPKVWVLDGLMCDQREGTAEQMVSKIHLIDAVIEQLPSDTSIAGRRLHNHHDENQRKRRPR
jgi:amidase